MKMKHANLENREHVTTRDRVEDSVRIAINDEFKARYRALVQFIDDDEPFKAEMKRLQIKFEEDEQVGLIGVRSTLDLLLAEITKEADRTCPVLFAQMKTVIEFATEPFKPEVSNG